MNYTCCMCKETKNGTPASKNGAGDFCADCHAERCKRMRESYVDGHRYWDGKCIWCGETITDLNRDTNKGDREANARVCRFCVKNREWLLGCIRHGDKAFEYVSRVEGKEKPGRVERKKNAKAEKAKVIPQELKVEPKNISDSERLAKLEAMIHKLTSALGGV